MAAESKTLVRLFDETGGKVTGRTFTDAARAEEWGADALGMETSLGLIVTVARFYAEGDSGEWVLHGEMEC